jgi:hypothetical protein
MTNIKYLIPHREHVLSPEQEVACLKVADNLVATMQMLLDDRLEEEVELKLLMTEDTEEELQLAKSRILTEVKRIVRLMSSL